MADSTNADAAAGKAAADANKGDAAAGTTDVNKTGDAAATPFDTSKLTEDDLAKLYDDPRLYNHPRFKQLNERAKKAKEFEENQARMEEESLKKKGEFEKLASQKDEEAKSWKSKFTTSLTDNAILAAASKKGIQDVDAALKLIDRSNVNVDDDGKVSGVDSAIEALAKDKPYLLSINRGKVGSATNPADTTAGAKKFKFSDVSNVEFYQKNFKEIQEAMRTGNIDYDA